MEKKKKLSRMGVCACCDIAVEFYRKNFRTLLPLFAVYLPLEIGALYCLDIKTLIGGFTGDAFSMIFLSQVIRLICGELLSALAAGVALVFNGATAYYTFFRLTTGGKPSYRFMLKRGGIYGMFRLLWTGIAFYSAIMAVYFGLLIGIIGSLTADLSDGIRVLLIVGVAALVLIPTAWLFLRWSMAAPLMVVRNRNIFPCLKESWRFTAHRKWKTIRLLCAALILQAGGAAVIGAAVVWSGNSPGIAPTLCSAAVRAVSALASFVLPIAEIVYILSEESEEQSRKTELELNRFLSERGV